MMAWWNTPPPYTSLKTDKKFLMRRPSAKGFSAAGGWTGKGHLYLTYTGSLLKQLQLSSLSKGTMAWLHQGESRTAKHETSGDKTRVSHLPVMLQLLYCVILYGLCTRGKVLVHFTLFCSPDKYFYMYLLPFNAFLFFCTQALGSLRKEPLLIPVFKGRRSDLQWYKDREQRQRTIKEQSKVDTIESQGTKQKG